MIFALAFALFLVGLVALVVDAATLDVWASRVQTAAQVAAQAGANSIDPRFVYGASSHLVDLDGAGSLTAFERGCVQSGDQTASLTDTAGRTLSADSVQASGNGVRCASDGCRVYALVEKTVHLPMPFFGDTVVVRGAFWAAPVVGGTQALPVACTAQAWVPRPPP
ncbi:MAG: hypothetical protein ACYDAC_03700 [Candidatus Dormibacteria bacterium]